MRNEKSVSAVALLNLMDMDSQDTERIKIVKPVASRPSHSTYRSFTELLAGAIDETPESSPQASLVPIRPKTVRFKPTASRLQTPNSAVSSQAETSGTAISHLAENVPKLDAEPIVVYKPLASLVSKTTASLLAKMGNCEASNQAMQGLQPGDQRPVKDKSSRKPQLSSNDDRSAASGGAETHQTVESLHTGASLNAEDGKKYIPAVVNRDRPAYDVYNWRKYGQKQVKGSEYPRSYHKCTHPGCPVKKKVERSLDGEITEIVYKGEHIHLKPRPAKRGCSSQPAEPATDGVGQDDGNPISSNEALGRADNGMETGFAAASDFSFPGKGPTLYNHSAGDALGQAGTVQDSSCGLSGEEDVSKGKEVADFEPRRKRRRSENRSEEAGLAEQGELDPSATKPNLTDPDKLSDGFRWRKYGQKVVKGNPYPRSYYRCTSLKCNVRKYVERASDDPRSFVTTYEGKHNHEMPSKSSNNNNNNNKNTNNL